MNKIKVLPFILAVFLLAPFFCVNAITTHVTATITNDWDSDGMPNTWETLYGFNPNDPSDAALDADGDGLTNLEEYNRGTNPLIADTDGGGVNDGDEVDHGTDPLDSTDDYNYLIPTEKKVYEGEPEPAKDKRADSDGDGVPNILEKQYGTNPNAVDTDFDGVNDYAEIFIYHTNPNSRDSDLDGLTDYQEIFIYHTNPNFFDTDFDGMSDYDEIRNGTNPLVKESAYVLHRFKVDAYVTTLAKSYIDLYETSKFDVVENIAFKLHVSNIPEDTLTYIYFNNRKYIFSRNDFNVFLPGPVIPGSYKITFQFLGTDGRIIYFEKTINVRAKGQLLYYYKGAMTSLLSPILNVLSINPVRYLNHAKLKLSYFDTEKNNWVLYDALKFGFYNPQVSEDFGFYVFMIDPGKYKLEIFGLFNNVIYTGTFEKISTQIINDKIHIRLNFLNYIFCLFYN